MSLPLFLFDRPESVVTWSAVDDRVMGGVSRSTLRVDPAGHALFAGTVSADNNGGFASVRSALAPPAPGRFGNEGGGNEGLDAGDRDAIELEVRGDGRRPAAATGPQFETRPRRGQQGPFLVVSGVAVVQGDDEPFGRQQSGQAIEQSQRVGAAGDANDERPDAAGQSGRPQRGLQRRGDLADEGAHGL